MTQSHYSKNGTATSLWLGKTSGCQVIALNLIQELTVGSNWSPESWACNLDLLATTSVCKMIVQVARWKATCLQIVMVWLELTVHMNPTVLIWDASLYEWGVDSTGWQLVGVAWCLCCFAVKLLFCVTFCGRMLNLWRWTLYIYRQLSQWFICCLMYWLFFGSGW